MQLDGMKLQMWIKRQWQVPNQARHNVKCIKTRRNVSRRLVYVLGKSHLLNNLILSLSPSFSLSLFSSLSLSLLFAVSYGSTGSCLRDSFLQRQCKSGIGERCLCAHSPLLLQVVQVFDLSAKHDHEKGLPFGMECIYMTWWTFFF